MSKIILLISIYLVSGINSAMAQFTEKQIEELTVSGIYTALEPENYAVAKKSLELTEKFKSEDRISQICSIFDFIYKGWNYSLDPFGQEYFEKAGVSIYTLTGDCDDYAILMVSMIRSIGGDGRIICVSGHAYPEVLLGKDLSSEELDKLMKNINEYYSAKGSGSRLRRLNYHRDSDGTYWLNLDYQQRLPGGRFYEYSEDAEHLVIYSDGSHRLAYLNKE